MLPRLLFADLPHEYRAVCATCRDLLARGVDRHGVDAVLRPDLEDLLRLQRVALSQLNRPDIRPRDDHGRSSADGHRVRVVRHPHQLIQLTADEFSMIRIAADRKHPLAQTVERSRRVECGIARVPRQILNRRGVAHDRRGAGRVIGSSNRRHGHPKSCKNESRHAGHHSVPQFVSERRT